MSEEEQLKYLLKTLIREVKGISSVMILAKEGLPIFELINEDHNSLHISALSAILYKTAERLSLEGKKSYMDFVLIQNNDGKIMVFECGDEAYLSMFIEEDARLDLIFAAVKKTIKNIEEVLDF
ncbi:MAG: hypothetical protein GF364_08735 [Candidatus Lokiarchaeota archaeon]|nr:hypothetical protein [Candidatus Lokiarchaeota archaeon]